MMENKAIKYPFRIPKKINDVERLKVFLEKLNNGKKPNSQGNPFKFLKKQGLSIKIKFKRKDIQVV